MPQLDAITFSTQIFWLLILFVSFYFFVLKHILPNILLNLKVRQTTLNNLEMTQNNVGSESNQIIDKFTTINLKLSNILDDYLNNVRSIVNTYNNYLNISLNFNKNLNDRNLIIIPDKVRKEILKQHE